MLLIRALPRSCPGLLPSTCTTMSIPRARNRISLVRRRRHRCRPLAPLCSSPGDQTCLCGVPLRGFSGKRWISFANGKREAANKIRDIRPACIVGALGRSGANGKRGRRQGVYHDRVDLIGPSRSETPFPCAVEEAKAFPSAECHRKDCEWLDLKSAGSCLRP